MILPGKPMLAPQIIEARRVARLPKTSATCPCARNAGTLHVRSRDDWGIPLRFHSCYACGGNYQSQRLTDDALATFYQDHYAPLYWPRGRTQRLWNSAEHRPSTIAMTLYAALGRWPRRVLDVGGGPGDTMLPLVHAGCSVSAVDPDPSVRSEWHRHGIHDAGDWLSEATGSYDAVVLSHVVEHLPDPAGTLEQVRRLLAPGGVVYVEVPGPGRWARKGSPMHVAHLANYTPATLYHVAQRAGLGVAWYDRSIRAVLNDGPHRVEEPEPEVVHPVQRRMRWAVLGLIPDPVLQHRIRRHQSDTDQTSTNAATPPTMPRSTEEVEG